MKGQAEACDTAVPSPREQSSASLETAEACATLKDLRDEALRNPHRTPFKEVFRPHRNQTDHDV